MVKREHFVLFFVFIKKICYLCIKKLYEYDHSRKNERKFGTSLFTEGSCKTEISGDVLL